MGAEGAEDEWFVHIEELISVEKRVFPINVVSRSRASGGYEIVYARDPKPTA